MKVIINPSTGDKTGKRKTSIAKHLEGTIFKTAFASLFLLVAVQALLFHPIFRSLVTDDRRLEGELLTREAYFFLPCKMEMKLINLDSCPDLGILVNGEKRASFEGNTVLLELKEGDVVDLDAGSILVEAVVQISAVSDNIPDFLGKTLTVTDGINRVALVRPARY